MMISDDTALAAFTSALNTHAAVGLDTEFLRERTYFAQLCLLQLGLPDQAVCIDTLALRDLALLKPAMAATGICKVVHAARQDLEVLWPAVGLVANVFDTQVAAALLGLSAQIGYAELCRQLLGRTLNKAHTRADWSRRPLSAEQIEYALDDVRYLLPLHELLSERLSSMGRMAWFEEEMRDVGNADSFVVEPDQAWRRLKGIVDLDPQRLRLAAELAAWRERRAISSDRPRSWIMPDAALRDIVLRAPRTMQELAGIAELPDGIRNHSGAQILAVIAAQQLPARLPDLPQRRRADPARLEAVKKLAAVTQRAGQEFGLAPEILATRREMEQLAAGDHDVAALSGWRREVIGNRLLQAL